MAVISNAVTSIGQIKDVWKIPPAPTHSRTLIPRGLFEFNGSAAIASKLAANQTRLTLTLDFNDNFCFLLKSVGLRLEADAGSSMDFSTNAVMQISDLSGGSALVHPLTSPGKCYLGGSLKETLSFYLEPNAPHPLIDGNKQDFSFAFADVSADASGAGDLDWAITFLMYDIEQCNHYPVQTPIPTIAF